MGGGGVVPMRQSHGAVYMHLIRVSGAASHRPSAEDMSWNPVSWNGPGWLAKYLQNDCSTNAVESELRSTRTSEQAWPENHTHTNRLGMGMGRGLTISPSRSIR